MEIPVRSIGHVRAGSIRVAGLLALGALLASCATQPPVAEGPAAPLEPAEVRFPTGRVTVVVHDETGRPMGRTRVDFGWDRPQFYRTSGFTDQTGRVTFNGVPEMARVMIDHPGGMYSESVVVPQRGTSELFVILDTYGEYSSQNSLQGRYERERAAAGQ